MPRPSSISALHGLKYDLRRAGLKDADLRRIQAEYEAALEALCKEHRCTKVEMLLVLGPDFGKWMRDEQLPPLTRHSD